MHVFPCLTGVQAFLTLITRSAGGDLEGDTRGPREHGPTPSHLPCQLSCSLANYQRYTININKLRIQIQSYYSEHCRNSTCNALMSVKSIASTRDRAVISRAFSVYTCRQLYTRRLSELSLRFYPHDVAVIRRVLKSVHTACRR